MNRSSLTLLLILFVGLFYGCHFSHTQEKAHFFSGSVWNRFVPFEDTLKIEHPDLVYDLNIQLSVWNTFEHSLIPLQVIITYPNGQESVFVKHLSIKDLDGNFLGSAKGDIWTTNIDVFSEREFPEKGNYIINIQNLTQYYDLPKVSAISFTLNGQKPKKN